MKVKKEKSFIIWLLYKNFRSKTLRKKSNNRNEREEAKQSYKKKKDFERKGKKLSRIDEFNFLGRDLLIVVSDVRQKPELYPAIIPVIR